ncbi:MAG: hypothetical protein WCT04_21070 [Planctomycetota bacterium]
MPFITQFNGKQPSSDGPARRVEKGAVDNARRSLVSVLEDKFERVPADAMKTLDAIDDPHKLTLLMRLAVRVATLKEFLTALNAH